MSSEVLPFLSVRNIRIKVPLATPGGLDMAVSVSLDRTPDEIYDSVFGMLSQNHNRGDAMLTACFARIKFHKIKEQMSKIPTSGVSVKDYKVDDFMEYKSLK
jgi:hypothetical protein